MSVSWLKDLTKSIKMLFIGCCFGVNLMLFWRLEEMTIDGRQNQANHDECASNRRILSLDGIQFQWRRDQARHLNSRFTLSTLFFPILLQFQQPQFAIFFTFDHNCKREHC